MIWPEPSPRMDSESLLQHLPTAAGIRGHVHHKSSSHKVNEIKDVKEYKSLELNDGMITNQKP